MTREPRTKVCCITSLDEARDAIRLGASAVGFVSSMPSGPGVIPEKAIAAIASAIPPPIGTFLLTCATSAEAIVAQQRRCRTNTVQLCDYVDSSIYRDLRRELPGIALVQVIHVVGPVSVELARAAAGHVDALLLDSGDTTSSIKLLGGTGRTHDWATSRRIREAVPVPVFLAGGLTAANVQEAIAAVQPFGLDVCSGVRTDSRLDITKLSAFFSALRAVA